MILIISGCLGLPYFGLKVPDNKTNCYITENDVDAQGREVECVVWISL